MRQIIIDIASFNFLDHHFSLRVYGYGLMLVLGFLISIYLGRWRARRCGEDPDVVTKIGLLSLIGGIVGARLAYIIQHWDTQFANTANPLGAALDITSGGLIYHGGLILATLMVLVYLRSRKLSARRYLDIVTVSLMVGLAFGRAGCLFNGCCYGSTCRADWPLGVHFPLYSQPLVKLSNGAGPFSTGTEDASPVYAHQFETGLLRPDERLYDPVPPGRLWPPRYLHGKLTNDQLAVVMDESQWEGQFKALVGPLGRIDEATWQRARAKGDGLLRGSENWGEAVVHFDRNGDDRLSLDEMRQYLRVRRAWISARFAGAADGQLTEDQRQAANAYLQDDLYALAAVSRSDPVKPTQLLSMLTALLLAGLLAAFFRLRRREGQVFALAAIAYPLVRFVEEGIRDTNAHDLARGIFTHNQYTALAIAAAGVIMMIWLQRLSPSAGPVLAERLATSQCGAAKGKAKS